MHNDTKKYFDLWYNLLNIENKYKQVEECISTNIHHEIVNTHCFSLIFSWYQDFLNKKITEEEFLKIGDISWDTSKKMNSKKVDKLDSFQIFNSLKYKLKNNIIDDWIQDKIFVFDNFGISADDIVLLQKFLEKQNSFLFVV